MVTRADVDREFSHERFYSFDAREGNLPIISAIRTAVSALLTHNRAHAVPFFGDADEEVLDIMQVRWSPAGVTLSHAEATVWTGDQHSDSVHVLANGELDASLVDLLRADPLCVDAKVLRPLPAWVLPSSVLHRPAFVAARAGTLYHVVWIDYENNGKGVMLIGEDPPQSAETRDCMNRWRDAMEADARDPFDAGYSFGWLTKASNPVSEHEARLRVLATHYERVYSIVYPSGFDLKRFSTFLDEAEEGGFQGEIDVFSPSHYLIDDGGIVGDRAVFC
jgi:hypothetical protein